MTPLRRAAVALAALAAAAPAQDGIRITRVPELLVLPLDAGRNALLEVQTGAASVWLATDPASGARVPLTHAGAATWQLNLADPRVAALARDPAVAALVVLGERDGRTLRSVAIAFVRVGPGPIDRCEVHFAGGAEPRTLARGGRAWLDAAAVERIAVSAGGAGSVVARAGDLELQLDRDGDAFVLSCDDGVRAAWRGARVLEITALRGDAVSAVCTLLAIPATLDLPAGGAQLTVVQRRSAAVPGSGGGLRLRLGDITRGQVLLELTRGDGAVAIPRRPFRERDRAEFALAGGRYTVVLDRLVNVLIGDDWAELRIVGSEGIERDPIGELLRCIEEADVVFVRDGQDYGGERAALHVRAKLRLLGREPTLDEFIDEVASRSSTTGEAYAVRLADGTLRPMRVWLRAERERLDAAAERR